jgi:hypothetical protein
MLVDVQVSIPSESVDHTMGLDLSYRVDGACGRGRGRGAKEPTKGKESNGEQAETRP